METAETNLQTVLNGVAKWTRQKVFKISPEKNSMHANMQEKDSQSSRPGDSIEWKPSGN
jgi:hypothetical protein